MMAKLSHPIAAFVATVLAVIGIGVGVVVVAQAPRVYGPSWGRFTAAFSGPVYLRRGRTSTSYNPLGGAGVPSPFHCTVTLMFADLSYSNVQGWVGYLP